MVVFLIALQGWLLIYSFFSIRNGLHIIRFGEEGHRWLLRDGESVSGLVGEPLSKLIGYLLAFSGILTVLAATWVFIKVAMGDGLPFDIFQPLLCLIFLGLGPLAIVRFLSDRNRLFKR